MANVKLFRGGIADFSAMTPGVGAPQALGRNPLKYAGHMARDGGFLCWEVDFSRPSPERSKFLSMATPIIADTWDVLVVPQRSLVLGACVYTDVPIAGLAFDMAMLDDSTTGPALDRTYENNGTVFTVDDDKDAVTTDDAPGTDGTGTAWAIGSAYSTATVGQLTVANPIATQAVNEQALIRLTLTAIPNPAFTTLSKGKFGIGIWVRAAMFPSID